MTFFRDKKYHTICASVALLIMLGTSGMLALPLIASAQRLPTPKLQGDNIDFFNPNANNDFLTPVYIPSNSVELPQAGVGTAAEKQANDARIAVNQRSQADELAAKFTCLGWNVGINIKGCLAGIMDIIMWIAARALWVAGILFNVTLYFTLNLSALLDKMPIVDIGWKVLRDLANIVFIFITLWCGISITLGIGDNGKKAWGYLAQMVLVALFINFSLFITKAVVDVSNIAALHFYSLTVDPEHQKDWDGGISEAYLYGLKLSTLYNIKQIGAWDSNRNSLVGSQLKSAGKDNLDFGNIILIGFFGSLLIIVTAWVFFAGAIMFIYRAITLIILMMLSPLAFVGLILPGASGMAHQWWSKLWSQAFFAPLYLALAYIVVRTINSDSFQLSLLGGASGSGLVGALTGSDPNAIAVIFNFIILIGLMVGSLMVASHLGARGSEMAMAGWEKIQGATIGIVGATTRGIIKTPSATLRGAGNIVSNTPKGLGRATSWMANTRLLKGSRLGNVVAGLGNKMQKRGQEFHERGIGKKIRKVTGVASKAMDVRYLEERAGQSWLGNTTIGKGVRAATIGGAANLKIGDKSLQEAHEVGEEQETARHIISLIAEARGRGSELEPLWHEQDHLNQEKVDAEKKQEEGRKELEQAERRPLTAQEKKKVQEAEKELEQAKVIPDERKKEIQKQKQKIQESDKNVAAAKTYAAAHPNDANAQEEVKKADAELAKRFERLKELETHTPEEQERIAAAEARLEAARYRADPELIKQRKTELVAAKQPTPEHQEKIQKSESTLEEAKTLLKKKTEEREESERKTGVRDIVLRSEEEKLENLVKRRTEAAEETRKLTAEEQGRVAKAEKALDEALHPPLTKEQEDAKEVAIRVANDKLDKAAEDLERASKNLAKFKQEKGAKMAELVAKRSNAFSKMSAQEFVHYAPKEDKKRMDFESDPPGHFLAVMEDEHLTEEEKEEATHHYVHRLWQEARRGENRNERFNELLLNFQKKFGKKMQVVERLAKELERQGFVEQLKELRRKITEAEEREEEERRRRNG